ncbi:hypothetical protein [Tropicibacter oceani]|uniref:Uncharacterized protein n=1 Tax=Tropicibacter oceani TaxID=3058420 RepID=A0ABY8QDI3_9RHOB|nr:hypothetical protein [Tropicibacter oceani]WGW02503.1 hypothetical protein QF118_11155 [Tropicibacter oceani]
MHDPTTKTSDPHSPENVIHDAALEIFGPGTFDLLSNGLPEAEVDKRLT